MAINFVKMFSTEGMKDDGPEANKQKMALAQRLLASEVGPIYSGGAAAAKIAEKAFGGFLAGQAERDENEANEKAGSMLANALMNWGGAGGDSRTTNAQATNTPDAPSPSAASAPSFAGGGSSRSMEMPTGTSFSEIGARLHSDLARDLNLTPEQAAGVVGNLAHESAGFGTLQEVKPMVPGSRGGFGYAQWTGPRRKAFEEWSAANKLDPTSYDANYGFLKHELTNTPEGRVLEDLRRAPDAATATQVFSSKFLRPGIPGMDSRQKWTQRALSLPGQVASADPNFVPQAAPQGEQGAPQAAPAPVQVAQANPLAQALQAPPPAVQGMNPQQQEIVRQLLGNPRTRAAGVQLLQQHQQQVQAAQEEYRQREWDVKKLQVQRGYQVEDREDGQTFQEKQAEAARKFDRPYKDSASSVAQGNLDIARERLELERKPTSIREAEAAMANPDVKATMLELKRSGAQNINLPGAEKEEEKERGKGLGSRLNKIAEDGDAAVMDMTVIQRMNTLGNNVDPGSRTAFFEELRQRTGIQLDPKADDVQAFKAIVNYMKPRMKVPGSGTSSDRDMESFEQALMNMRATPGGNEIIAQTLGGMAQLRIQRGEIAQLWQMGEISAKDASDRMKALPDPFDTFKQWQKQNPNAPKGAPGTTVAPDPSKQPAPEAPPPGYPKDASKAPDGKWYVPDPNRPGKFLRVEE